jgi:general secretion pathway protein D
VTIKVALEVSSLGQKSVTKSGSEVYRVGTRNASTTLALRDGETQALAGLISDEERKTVSGIPGFGQIPALGRLFANKSNSTEKTEIVLLITPHIVRNLDRTALAAADFAAGTDSAAGSAPLNLQSIAPDAEPVSSADVRGEPSAAGHIDPAVAESADTQGTDPAASTLGPASGAAIETRDPSPDPEGAVPGENAPATGQEGE